MRRQQGYTLVEILVVVALVGMLAAYGMTTYGRFEARSRTEMVAKELITYIRQAQMYARNGDRGPDIDGNRDCHGSAATIAEGKSSLSGWEVALSANSATSKPCCTTSGSTTSCTNGIGYGAWKLPSGFTLLCGDGSREPASANCKSLFVRSIFGNTYYNYQKASHSGDKKAVFVIKADGWDLYYHFALSNGAITSGDFCKWNTTDANEKCSSIDSKI